MTVGEKLYRLRKDKGLSQEQLAAELSVSRQTLSKWEAGAAVPDTENVLKISAFFGVSTDYLLKQEWDGPEGFAREKSAAQPSANFKLSKKALRMVEEKGYVGAYLLAALCLPGLLASCGIGFAYLTVLSSVAPLDSFPSQAFILPGAAAVVAVLMLGRMAFFLFVAHKLKKLQKRGSA